MPGAPHASAGGADLLALDRFAALDRLAVGGVAVEEGRQAVPLAECRTVLQVEVQVRFAGVPAVAAATQLVARFDRLPRRDADAALAEVGEDREFPAAKVHDHVV